MKPVLCACGSYPHVVVGITESETKPNGAPILLNSIVFGTNSLIQERKLERARLRMLGPHQRRAPANTFALLPQSMGRP